MNIAIRIPRWAASLAVTALVAACGQSADKQAAPQPAASTATPDAAVLAAVHALRTNDFAAFLNAALPADRIAKAKANWGHDIDKGQVSDEDRKQFADLMVKLTEPGAEDKIYAELEPTLRKFDEEIAKNPAQQSMMIGLGQGMLQNSIQQNPSLNDAQKQQAVDLIGAMGQWAQGVQFTDPKLVKATIAVLCKTARDLNLKSIDEMRALSYEQSMSKIGILAAGLKQALDVYGLKVDQTLDSVKAETLGTTGDTAQVRITLTAFGKPFTGTNELVRIDGKWYDKKIIDAYSRREEQAKAAADAAAKQDAAAGDKKPDQDKSAADTPAK